jgi:hypothetical protein
MEEEAAIADGTHLVAFEVYGTRACVSVPDPQLAAQVLENLPMYAAPSPPQKEDRMFAVRVEDDGRYAVLQDGKVVSRPPALEGALTSLRRRLFRHAIEHARDRLVVHAGVVGYQGRAIVMPGSPMAGKTTLVIALLRAGADYYTDDFAPLDGDGLVHPYPSRIFVKGQEDKSTAEDFGALRGEVPLPVAVIASIRYAAGARWEPRECTSGEGALMLMRHAYGMDVPEFALRAARSAVADAVVIESERDEADPAAQALLGLAARTLSTQ